MADTSKFRHPLEGRYASMDMLTLWSDDEKFRIWRWIWYLIAKTQRDLGVEAVHDDQLEEMCARMNDIPDYARVAELESKLKHDVMAHVYAFGEVCPKARPIIHLCCTSCDITDNAESFIIRRSIELICGRLVGTIRRLADFAGKYRDMPTLGWTHYQSAQPVTVGKRACMWLQDLLICLNDLDTVGQDLRLRGLKGTTGTQASFLALFKGDHEMVRELDDRFRNELGFESTFMITGQTYTRMQDTKVLAALATLAAAIHKIATDLRLLAHDKEIEEPFGKAQIGSSAMAYKRNPMKSERACSISREPIANLFAGLMTQATQWLERSLDDSAIRRMVMSEAFLSMDAILMVMQDVFGGLVVYPKVIERRLWAELPFMATEEIIVAMVESGADRQEVHERIRVHSVEAATQVKVRGLPNNFLELIAGDGFFAPVHDKLESLLDPKLFIGRAAEQVDEFLEEEVEPTLSLYPCDEEAVELKV